MDDKLTVRDDLVPMVMTEELAVLLRPGVPADHYWSKWQQLVSIRSTISDASQAKSVQWKNATDRDIKAGLWSEFEELCRHYDIVTAWCEVVRAAYVFTTTGTTSEYLGTRFSVTLNVELTELVY